jgi:hypothetical protein
MLPTRCGSIPVETSPEFLSVVQPLPVREFLIIELTEGALAKAIERIRKARKAGQAIG